MMHHLPTYCSASEMFTVNRVSNCAAVIRRFLDLCRDWVYLAMHWFVQLLTVIWSLCLESCRLHWMNMLCNVHFSGGWGWRSSPSLVNTNYQVSIYHALLSMDHCACVRVKRVWNKSLYIYIYNSVITCRQNIIKSSASAPLNPRDTRGTWGGGFRGSTIQKYREAVRLAPTWVHVCGFIWEWT